MDGSSMRGPSLGGTDSLLDRMKGTATGEKSVDEKISTKGIFG